MMFKNLLRTTPVFFLILVFPGLLDARASQAIEGEMPLEPPEAFRPYADQELRRISAILEKESHETGAFLHLADLEGLLGQISDLAILRNTLAKVAVDRRAHPEVRAYARLLAAKTEWHRGRFPRALAWMGPLDMMTHLWIAGPFDNEGGSGFDVPWPPEVNELAGDAPDPTSVFQGKAGSVSWRQLPDLFPLGYIDLSAVMEPSREVVVYLRAAFDSSRVQPAALRMGTPGPTKVWLNGEEVFSSTADHPPRFDQHVVPMVLSSGFNTLLVKVTHRQGDLGVFLRLSDVTGAQLRGINHLAPDTRQSRRLSFRRQPPPPAVDTLLSSFQREYDENPDDPKVVADLARVMALRHPFDRTQRAHLELARSALQIALEREVAYSIEKSGAGSDIEVSALFHLLFGFEQDHNRRRMALEGALEADSNYYPALRDLGLHYLGRGRARRALVYLERALEVSPNSVHAALALADAQGIVAFPEEEKRNSMQLAKVFPTVSEVIRMEAGLAREEERLHHAAMRLRVGVGLYPGDDSMRNSLVAALLDLGLLEEAIEVMQEGLRFAPSTVYGRLSMADVLSANGRPLEAERLYSDAAKINPGLAEIHFRAGLHHLRHGGVLKAKENLDKAYRIRPQDPVISNLRSFLDGDLDDFSLPYIMDGRELARKAQEEGASGDEDLVCLAQITVVKVHPSGLSTRVHQEVYNVLTPRGAERIRSHSISYTPGDQILRIEQARVIRPDGTIVQARNEHERSLSEPWARLYYDQRARVVSFPELAPGDVVELIWRREDVSHANMFGDYFGDISFLQSVFPINKRGYYLIVPENREIFHNELDLPALVKGVESLDDSSRLYYWTAEDLDRVVPEAGMPGWSEVAPLLHVSTYSSWQEVAQWWWRLIEDQMRPTPELERLAEELVEGIPANDTLGRVAAIHNFVVKQTRYVGLEFGIHGYKPYRVDQIFERRFGDCKDKAALMHALLNVVDIESNMVILRMRNLGRVDDYPASLALFNHAILYIPDLELWLDGTGEFSGTSELPSMDQDAAVLVVDHENLENSWFGYVPVSDYSSNTSTVEMKVELFSDGSAHGEGSFQVRGTAAPLYRRSYQAAENRLHVYEQEWAASYPGVEVRKLEMPNLDNLEEPVDIAFSLYLPRFGRGDDSNLSFRPLGEGRGYGERFAGLSERRHDLILAFPFKTSRQYSVILPEGWKVAHLPEPQEEVSPFGRFSIDYKFEENELLLNVVVGISTARVSASEYQDFRRFLAKMDRALAREIRIEESR